MESKVVLQTDFFGGQHTKKEDSVFALVKRHAWLLKEGGRPFVVAFYSLIIMLCLINREKQKSCTMYSLIFCTKTSHRSLCIL